MAAFRRMRKAGFSPPVRSQPHGATILSDTLSGGEHAARELQQDNCRVLDLVAAQRAGLLRLDRRHLAAQVAQQVDVVDQVQ